MLKESTIEINKFRIIESFISEINDSIVSRKLSMDSIEKYYHSIPKISVTSKKKNCH